MIEVLETELPTVGKKYKLNLVSGGIVSVIVHSDGRKNVYYRKKEDAEDVIMLSLTEEEAHLLGAILGGVYAKSFVSRSV